MTEKKEFRRVLSNLRHGGHVLSQDLFKADPEALALNATTVPEATGAPQPYDLKEISTPFGYLFRDLRDAFPDAHLPTEPARAVVIALKALGAAMVDQSIDAPEDDSQLPPILTYWGQFVDHDLTANTDRNDDIGITDLPLEPLQPEKVIHELRNLREPQLNLDSVYGNGPGAPGPGQVPFDGDRFVLADPVPLPFPHVSIPGADLPRVEQKAQIGDGRNDENLIVAQLHTAFLRFHNAVLDWSAAHPDHAVPGVDSGFEAARRLVQWHYQWITVHDFLKQVALPEVVDDLLDGTTVPLFAPDPERVFMPLEFSVAAFRFGHSMVRATYDWNDNFGFPGDAAPVATFEDLFRFTGNGGLRGLANLPDNWPARFERLTGAAPRPAEASEAIPPRFARKIDTHLSPPLTDLANEGTDPELSERIRRILRRLAVRNLLRGYRLAIPSGQAVATSLRIVPLSTAQLLEGDQRVNDALIDGGFLDNTPLWFYLLKEAELGGGEHLGEVGSRIVAETIVGQLRLDPDSFLNHNWDPSQGVTVGPDDGPVDSIIRFLQFAGVHPV